MTKALNPLGHKMVRLILVMDDNTAYDCPIDEPMSQVGLSTSIVGIDKDGEGIAESTITLSVKSHQLRAVVLKDGDLPERLGDESIKRLADRVIIDPDVPDGEIRTAYIDGKITRITNIGGGGSGFG